MIENEKYIVEEEEKEEEREKVTPPITGRSGKRIRARALYENKVEKPVSIYSGVSESKSKPIQTSATRTRTSRLCRNNSTIVVSESGNSILIKNPNQLKRLREIDKVQKTLKVKNHARQHAVNSVENDEKSVENRGQPQQQRQSVSLTEQTTSVIPTGRKKRKDETVRYKPPRYPLKNNDRAPYNALEKPISEDHQRNGNGKRKRARDYFGHSEPPSMNREGKKDPSAASDNGIHEHNNAHQMQRPPPSSPPRRKTTTTAVSPEAKGNQQIAQQLLLYEKQVQEQSTQNHRRTIKFKDVDKSVIHPLNEGVREDVVEELLGE